MESARVVLVTNVGQGFGRAVALSYGAAGFDVVCADPDVDLASKTAAEVEELGGQAIPVQADMASLLEVRSAFARVFEIFGVLGGLVHVVSQESHARFDELSESEFAELLREDVTSTYLLLRTAVRLLRSGWVVVVAPPGGPSYPQMAAIQGAITGLTSALAGTPVDAPLAPRVHEAIDPEPVTSWPRVNVVVPSRSASDPRSDAALVHAVRYLGSAAAQGLRGAVLPVVLPPPPTVIETLLPEVQAALDDTVRQGDLDDDVDHLAPDGLEGEPSAYDDALREAGLDDAALERAEEGLTRLEEAAGELDASHDDDEGGWDERMVDEAASRGGWQR